MNVRSPADSTGIVGTLVSWDDGIGDDKKYHIAHVSSLGLTFVRKLKDHAKYQQLVNDANNQPANAIRLLRADPKAEVYPLADIARVTYADQLNQLFLLDKKGARTKIPDGKGEPQSKVFEAIKKQLGGTQSEEEADAWSVLQTPLAFLAFIAVLGGFFIYFTTICEPNYVASGRRSGIKQLMNSIGYAVGPFWASVGVGIIALLVVALAIYLLIKRPVRQILSFD